MSEKLRVYELAKEMLTDSKVVIRIMSQMGLDAKNHMSTLDQPTAQKIRDVLTGKAKVKTGPKDDAKSDSKQVRPPEPRPTAPQRSEATRSAERAPARAEPERTATRPAERQSWLDATRPATRTERVLQDKPGGPRPTEKPPKTTYSQVAQPGSPIRNAPGPGYGARPSWGAASSFSGPRPYTPGPKPNIQPRPQNREALVSRTPQSTGQRPPASQPRPETRARTAEDIVAAPALEAPVTPSVAPPMEASRMPVTPVTEAYPVSPERIEITEANRPVIGRPAEAERRQVVVGVPRTVVTTVAQEDQTKGPDAPEHIDISPAQDTAPKETTAVEETARASAPDATFAPTSQDALPKTETPLNRELPQREAPRFQGPRSEGRMPFDLAKPRTFERPIPPGAQPQQRPPYQGGQREAPFRDGGIRRAESRPGERPDRFGPRPQTGEGARQNFGDRPRPAGAQGFRQGPPGAPRPAGAQGFRPGAGAAPRPAGGFNRASVVIPPAPPTQAGEAARPGGRTKQKSDTGRYEQRHERRQHSEEGQRLSKLRKGYPVRRTETRRVTEPPKEVVIEGPIILKDLATKMALPVTDLIKRLLQKGVMMTINQELDIDTAQIVGSEIGIQVRYKAPELSAEEKMEAQAQEEDAAENLEWRPPVVTVMGHVDHGKTSLLDAIRETNVAAGEAGGITQHIGASVVEINDRKVVFLDTPGHEAFTAMRARGAEATDIAVLVVAADDGVMPQTIEAINHAKAAEVPIVVAMNKIDKPNSNPELVKRQLLDQGLVAEEWGGQTIVVPVSARQKEGIDTLLEMILLTAEMEELKANPNRLARGFVIEAELDKGRGPVATVLVQNGTLHIGDAFVTGATYGRVRAMMDDKGRRVRKAGPSTPVEVVGLTDLPQAGDIFQVVADERIAKEIAQQRSTRKRANEMETTHRATLDDLFHMAQEGQIRDLNILVKADVQGSLEAIRKAIEDLKNEEVKVNILHEGVGGINRSDVTLASTSNAIILGFNVRPDAGARQLAETDKVDIRTYRVIYDAVDDIKAALTGLRKPKKQEVTYGRAEVRAIFKVPKVGTVAGCYVTDGKALRSAGVRVVRDGIVIHEGKLSSLKRFKDDAREVQEGFECGIGLERFQDLKEGDILEFFGEEEVKVE